MGPSAPNLRPIDQKTLNLLCTDLYGISDLRHGSAESGSLPRSRNREHENMTWDDGACMQQKGKRALGSSRWTARRIGFDALLRSGPPLRLPGTRWLFVTVIGEAVPDAF